MFKTLTAALVAASVLIAPLAASAETAPATKPVTTTTKVDKVKGHKRHFARHHKRIKVVKHVRGHKKIVAIKKTRHGKIVKAHKHAQVAVKAPKAAN
jgi:Ni/Co efflux regulator RcnB